MRLVENDGFGIDVSFFEEIEGEGLPLTSSKRLGVSLNRSTANLLSVL